MTADASSPIERIKQKLDIVEEIGAVVQLRKSGRTYKGLCPFHNERTPSFHVYPDDGAYKCYGCGEGGDIFTFVQKTQGLDFVDALKLLAEKANIPLESGGYGEGGSAEESPEASARKRLRALNEAAAIWYHHQLLRAPEAQYARTYLESRGVNSDSIALWRLGYAPEGDALTRYLLDQGYTPKELIDAGLTREREASRGGGLYDYFRNRVIFPIRDARNQTIAFGGRELGGATPKYLNTPQTLVFDKSATLYGLDLARETIRKRDRVIFVEGYMDAIVTHQYGSRNVVAVIGSAITEKHIKQIKKLTRRVTLALDPDAAGESATLRGITVAQHAFDRVVVPVPGPAPESPSHERRRKSTKRPSEPRGMVRFEEQVDAEITVAKLPPHEDPDEFVRRDTPGWERAIETATPLIDYLIEAQTAGLALDTPQGKLEACRRLLPIIAEVRDRTLADEYLGRLAQRVRLDKVELRRDLHLARQRLDREARLSPREEQVDDEPDAREAVERQGEKYRPSEQVGSSASYSSTVAGGVRASGGVGGTLLAEQSVAEYCLGVLLERPRSWTEIRAIVDERDFTSPDLRAIFATFAAAISAGAFVSLPDFVAGLPVELQPAVERVRARTEPGLPDEGAVVNRIASKAAYHLKRMRVDAELAELDALERDAEQAVDAEALRLLVQRKQALLAQRRAIDAATSPQGGRSALGRGSVARRRDSRSGKSSF